MILSVKTSSRTELIDITSTIAKLVKESGVTEGLCMLYVPHTTGAVTINESADPSVRGDILMVLNQIIPWDADYKHMEGIFFCEFDGPRTRKVHVRIIEQRFV